MVTNKFQLPSLAKINWFLHVFGKRRDGYHEICTAFQTVSLSDELTFEENDDLLLTCDRVDIPTNEDNLIVKSAKLLSNRFKIKKGAKIHLTKRIPFPGGLGGGSSNAAITLLGLSKLWDVKVDPNELVELGSQVGADVPFFFYGGTALGKGKGTEISMTNEIKREFIVLAIPKANISTAEAYSKLALHRLTTNSLRSTLHVCSEKAEEFNSRRLALVNDFEKGVFDAKPEIKCVKEKLLDCGARHALMSGSGSSVFGIFDNNKERQMALRNLKSDKGLRIFSVKTVSRLEYRGILSPLDKLLPKDF